MGPRGLGILSQSRVAGPMPNGGRESARAAIGLPDSLQARGLGSPPASSQAWASDRPLPLDSARSSVGQTV